VQNQSEDVLGGAAETGAQSISSVAAEQDRLATETCKRLSSMRTYGQRQLLFPESNSVIRKWSLQQWLFLDMVAYFGYH